MSKKILRIEHDFNFTLIGIASSAKEYRLCWFLNKELHLDFIKTDDLELEYDRSSVCFFSIYKYIIENTETEYYYISNKGINGFLIPERKETDYFFMANKKLLKDQEKEFLAQINKIELVQAAYLMNPKTIKSKENLLFY